MDGQSYRRGSAMSKAIEFMGMQLKNPILVGAGPWSRNGEAMQRSIDAGAAAVCTKTITLEATPRVCPRLYLDGDSLFNTTLHSELHLEHWESELETLKKGDCKLICSIWGSSPSELSYLATRVERMGADAIEISISAPVGSRNQYIYSHSPDIRGFVEAAVKAVQIPVMVKLSYEAAASPEFLSAIADAGAAGVSAIDAMRGLSGIDIETCRARMPAYGGYTGKHIHAIALAVTASLRQYTPMQICSVGGIGSYEDVLEFLMLGATCVQLASALQLHGHGVISRILSDLDAWLPAHGYSSAGDVCGAALKTLVPFEDINPRPLRAALQSACREDCGLCIEGCLYDAINRGADGGIALDSSRCAGCGFCAARCPKHRFSLEWA